MAYTAADVKALRERSGAGMMECKKALTQTGGYIEAAIEWLRKQGLAKADKKASRVAAEGRIAVAQQAGALAPVAENLVGLLLECGDDEVSHFALQAVTAVAKPDRAWLPRLRYWLAHEDSDVQRMAELAILKFESDVERVFRRFCAEDAYGNPRAIANAPFYRPRETAGEVWALNPGCGEMPYADVAEPDASIYPTR